MIATSDAAAQTRPSSALPSPDGGVHPDVLPKGWRWVMLGDVVESMKNGLYRPASSYADDGVACLRMYNIADGRIVWRDIKRMTLSEEEIREYELLPGDLLVNRVNSRELVGKAAAIPAGLERSVFESKNIRLRLRRDLVSPEFVSFRLQSAGSAYFNRNAQQVVGMASISQPQVARFPLPLPPLDEQRRLVAEIEKQFSRLDAGVAALRRVQANLKRYRAAVLKAACEGRLVPTEAELARKEGRNFESGGALLAHILDERRSNWEGKGKFREPASPSKSLNPLPAGWTWAHVEQLGDVQLGRQRSPKNVSKDYPTKYIRAANITEGGLDLSDVLEMEFSPAERERFSLRPGDVVLSEASGSPSQVGKPAIWRNELPLCCFQNTVLRLRPTAVDPKYVLVTFQCFYANGIFAQVAGGVGINHLGAEKFSAIPFPLPPLAEQARIVAEVERRLSVVQELEASVGTDLQRAARLRQSILRTAFSPGGRKGDLGGHALVAPSAP